jgi:hypothetical protein
MLEEQFRQQKMTLVGIVQVEITLEDLVEKMAKAAKLLNIKSHVVGDANKVLFSPVDLEVHKSLIVSELFVSSFVG